MLFTLNKNYIDTAAPFSSTAVKLIQYDPLSLSFIGIPRKVLVQGLKLKKEGSYWLLLREAIKVSFNPE